MKHLLKNVEETRAFAKQLAQRLKPGDIIALFGDLGSGKTTFVQGLIPSKEVTSPTFSYLHIYGNFYHFDLYRLPSIDDFIALGFQDYFFAGGICCIEWPEKIVSLLPPHSIHIHFFHEGNDIYSRHLKVGEFANAEGSRFASESAQAAIEKLGPGRVGCEDAPSAEE